MDKIKLKVSIDKKAFFLLICQLPCPLRVPCHSSWSAEKKVCQIITWGYTKVQKEGHVNLPFSLIMFCESICC